MSYVSPAIAPGATPSPGATVSRQAPAVPPAPVAADHHRPMPNPTLRLDAGLGMVVLEFRDDRGGVKNSIPSQRMLEAYRSHTEPLPGAATGTAPEATPSDGGERFA